MRSEHPGENHAGFWMASVPLNNSILPRFFTFRGLNVAHILRLRARPPKKTSQGSEAILIEKVWNLAHRFPRAAPARFALFRWANPSLSKLEAPQHSDRRFYSRGERPAWPPSHFGLRQGRLSKIPLIYWTNL